MGGFRDMKGWRRECVRGSCYAAGGGGVGFGGLGGGGFGGFGGSMGNSFLVIAAFSGSVRPKHHTHGGVSPQ